MVTTLLNCDDHQCAITYEGPEQNTLYALSFSLEATLNPIPFLDNIAKLLYRELEFHMFLKWQTLYKNLKTF
jgi:hypothetical protein